MRFHKKIFNDFLETFFSLHSAKSFTFFEHKTEFCAF